MATQISLLENTIENLESKLQHSESLIRVLGDPSQWRWTGDIFDAGAPVESCACGHQIRYVYPIVNELGQTNRVGSTCIYYFQEVNPDMAQAMRNALEELEKKIQLAKFQSKKAEQEAQVEQLRDKFQKLLLVANEYKDWYKSHGNGYCPKDLFNITTSTRESFGGIERKPPKYKRATDYIKWYTPRIERLEKITTFYQKEVENEIN